MPAHTETAFEAAIEQGLLTAGGYQQRKPTDYDETLALFPDDVIGFIQHSQLKRWAQLEALLADKTPAVVLACRATMACAGTLRAEVAEWIV